MKKAYICSPLRADTPGQVEYNKKIARALMTFAFLQGYAPFAPHLLYTQVLDDNKDEDRELGLLAGQVYLLDSDKIFALKIKPSEGMGIELNLAKEHYIKVKYVKLEDIQRFII